MELDEKMQNGSMTPKLWPWPILIILHDICVALKKSFFSWAIKTRQVNTVHQLHSTDMKSYGISVPIFVLLSILILGHLIYQRALLQQWKLLNIASFYNKSSFE